MGRFLVEKNRHPSAVLGWFVHLCRTAMAGPQGSAAGFGFQRCCHLQCLLCPRRNKPKAQLQSRARTKPHQQRSQRSQCGPPGPWLSQADKEALEQETCPPSKLPAVVPPELGCQIALCSPSQVSQAPWDAQKIATAAAADTAPQRGRAWPLPGTRLSDETSERAAKLQQDSHVHSPLPSHLCPAMPPLGLLGLGRCALM